MVDEAVSGPVGEGPVNEGRRRFLTASTLVVGAVGAGVTAIPFDRAAAVTDENIGDLFPERARLRGLKRLAFDFDQVFVAPVADHVADIGQLRRTFAFELLIGDAAFLAMSIL